MGDEVALPAKLLAAPLRAREIERRRGQACSDFRLRIAERGRMGVEPTGEARHPAHRF